MAVYIGRSINSRPSDQTYLKERHRCNLGHGGEPIFEGGADRWAQGGRVAYKWGRLAPHGSHLPFALVVCLLESSHVGFTVDKHD